MAILVLKSSLYLVSSGTEERLLQKSREKFWRRGWIGKEAKRVLGEKESETLENEMESKVEDFLPLQQRSVTPRAINGPEALARCRFELSNFAFEILIL